MALLQHQENIVGKGRKSGETSAEARHQQHIHRGRYDVIALGQAQQRTYNKTTHDIYREGAQGKCSHDEQIAQLARQESHTCADKASQAGDKHCFNHNVKIRIFLLGNKPHATSQKKYGTGFAPERGVNKNL
jgi:hypothetical protein